MITKKKGVLRIKFEENTDLIEELICSQEKAPHTQLASRKLAEQTVISRSSIRRMIKRRKIRQKGKNSRNE